MLILASKSPRRQELMRLITENFSIVTADTDESFAPDTPPDEVVQLLAQRKAEEILKTHPDATVIGADTIVYLDNKILGKPKDESDALRMLKSLSGREHIVYTGVCVLVSGESYTFSDISRVWFYSHDEDELRRYIATGEPMDKAGAYGIQGKGALLVRRIEGDFYNVMGLPVSKLYRALRECTNILDIKS